MDETILVRPKPLASTIPAGAPTRRGARADAASSGRSGVRLVRSRIPSPSSRRSASAGTTGRFTTGCRRRPAAHQQRGAARDRDWPPTDDAGRPPPSIPPCPTARPRHATASTGGCSGTVPGRDAARWEPWLLDQRAPGPPRRKSDSRRTYLWSGKTPHRLVRRHVRPRRPGTRRNPAVRARLDGVRASTASRVDPTGGHGAVGIGRVLGVVDSGPADARRGRVYSAWSVSSRTLAPMGSPSSRRPASRCSMAAATSASAASKTSSARSTSSSVWL